jgi:hypothetical protein
MSEGLTARIVAFHGDELVAVQQPDGNIFVHFARLCENLGLGRAPQVRRVQHHAVLSKGLVMLALQTDGGIQQVQCLRVDLLPLWMSGLHASRVKAEIRAKLIHYQEEAAVVLWQAFRPQILAEEATIVPADDTEAILELRRIAEMARAIADMAEQQIELQRQQHLLHRRLDTAARVIHGMQGQMADIDGRVDAVEVRLGVLEERVQPASFITEQQAAEISNRVKGLAQLLSTRDNSKNHYQSIFAEIYRRFGVSSYKTIGQNQYKAVLTFLDDWHASIS